MKKITIVWTILIILIFAGLTIFGFAVKDKEINNLMEESLLKETQSYLGLYVNLYPKLNETTTIRLEELIENGYNPELEKDCDGYVVIKNTNMGFKYYPYVKCPDYQTPGYN